MLDDFDDPIDDLIGGAPRERKPLPQAFTPALERVFTEACQKCGGTGTYRHFGQCFACKGQGKFTYKTSPEHRAKACDSAAKRSSARLAEKGKAMADFVEANKAEMTWLAAAAERQHERAHKTGTAWNFPIELMEKFAQYGSLTEGQLGAVRKCMAKDEARKAERATQKATSVVTLDASALQAAFDKANAKASRPGQMGVWTRPLTLRNGGKDDPAAIDVTFRMGSPGTQWAGKIFVRAGEKKLGVIVGGKFEPRFECSDAEKTAVLACSAEPAQAAIAYGKAWSVCSVCHATLTNDESIERGIGPVCAERFGF